MTRGAAAIIMAAAAIVALLSMKGWLLTPPAVPAQVSDGAFDPHRVHARLVRILGDGTPHPVDSAANDTVRTRILTELRAVGLRPRVTDASVCNSRTGARTVSCARVRNIVADIGPSTGPTLLLVAHYDSTPVGPGASDDGIGYASLIEIVHLLRGTTPRRAITLLLTDGEEAGLVGARAFVDRDPAAARVTHLINLESRGVSGPAFMFETSRPNAGPIAAFAAAAQRPVANSLSTDFYRLIPNSTDVAVFEARPWSILNFAVIGNETRYHTSGDTTAALDPRSLAHMGNQVFALARAWAAGVTRVRSGELIYADVLSFGLVTLPLPVGLVALGLLLLGFGWATWRSRMVGRGLAMPLAATAMALAAGWIGDRLARLLLTGDYWRGYPHVAALAVDIGAVGAALLALLYVGRRLDTPAARRGTWLFVVIVGAAASILAPGAAIFFLFPPAVVLLGIALAIRWPVAERVAAIVAAVMQFMLFAQLIAEIELLLVSGPVWATAALTALAVLPLLVELRSAEAPSPRPVAVVAAIALIAGWAAVLAVPRATPDRRARFVIEHVADANTGAARWGLATDGARLSSAFDPVGRWQEAKLPYSTRSRWVTRAPTVPLPPIGVRVTAVAGGRTSFRLIAPGATSVVLQFPAEARLTAMGMAGSLRRIDRNPGKDEYAMRCSGRSCDGATFVVERSTKAPLVVAISAMYPGLPAAAAPLLAARPANATAQYSPDARYVLKRIRL